VSFNVDNQCLQAYGDVWLSENYDKMSLRISSLSKEEILRCLQAIPCHLRPVYNSRSIRSCRCSLLLHVRNWIATLERMPSKTFFDTFFSVLPFWKEQLLSRSLLTEAILFVEYDDVLVSSLRRTVKSVNIKKCLHRRHQKKEDAIMVTTDWMQQISSTWPSVVPDDVIFYCLENYRRPSVNCGDCGNAL
jgi:hypothetical protein